MHLISDSQQRIIATFVSVLITRLSISPWQIIVLALASEKSYFNHRNTFKARNKMQEKGSIYSLSHMCWLRDYDVWSFN